MKVILNWKNPSASREPWPPDSLLLKIHLSEFSGSFQKAQVYSIIIIHVCWIFTLINCTTAALLSIQVHLRTCNFACHSVFQIKQLVVEQSVFWDVSIAQTLQHACMYMYACGEMPFFIQCFAFPNYFQIVLVMPPDQEEVCRRIAAFCGKHYQWWRGHI